MCGLTDVYSVSVCVYLFLLSKQFTVIIHCPNYSGWSDLYLITWQCGWSDLYLITWQCATPGTFGGMWATQSLDKPVHISARDIE